MDISLDIWNYKVDKIQILCATKQYYMLIEQINLTPCVDFDYRKLILVKSKL